MSIKDTQGNACGEDGCLESAVDWLDDSCFCMTHLKENIPDIFLSEEELVIFTIYTASSAKEEGDLLPYWYSFEPMKELLEEGEELAAHVIKPLKPGEVNLELADIAILRNIQFEVVRMYPEESDEGFFERAILTARNLTPSQRAQKETEWKTQMETLNAARDAK